MRIAAIGCLCGGLLAAVGCGDGTGAPTSPSASAAGGSVSVAAAPRGGELHVTKECSGYTGGAGSYCTITSSNIKAIEAGSKIIYLQPDRLETLSGSDVVLDLPGPGNNKASGNCSLASGVCRFSGGTGKFTGFQARVDVTATEDFSLWFWNGTYSFGQGD